MSNETKQQHTAEPWHFEKDNFSNFIMDSELNIICQLFNKYETDFPNFKPNAKRIVACVNAMEGIEDPEEFMSTVKEAFKEEKLSGAEVLNQFQNHFRYMDKFKTACESINPENPMAVAENLKEMVFILSKCAPALREAGYKTASKQIEELLTKIQSK